MKKSNSILNKFLSISVGSWIALIIGFISTPIATRLISPDQFGKVSMFLLAAEILGAVALLGADQSFNRFFYEEEEDKRKYLLLMCLKLSMAAFLVLSVGVLIFYKDVSSFIFSYVSFWLVLLLILYAFLRIINTYASVVVRMQQKGKVFSFKLILSKSLEFAGILMFAFFLGNQFEVIIYAYMFSMAVVSIVIIGVEHKFWNFFKKGSLKIKSHSSDILKYGVPLMITLLMTMLFESIDRIAIKHWSNYTEIGLYSAAFKIVTILNTLQLNFTAFWVPLSYEKFKENPSNTHFFRDMQVVVSYAMLIIAVLVIMFKDVIVLLLGSEYGGAAQIMPFLVFVPVLYTISEVTVVGINFYKKTKLHILIVALVCLCGIAGNLLLVPYIGATGAAISTGLSYIVFFSLRTYFSLKHFKVSYKLVQLYASIAMLVGYAFYATFAEGVWSSFFIGIAIFIIISLVYRSTVKIMCQKLMGIIGSFARKG